MSGAAVQDGVPGDLQRQLGLEVLIGQTVGALRPAISEQPLPEEVRRGRAVTRLGTEHRGHPDLGQRKEEEVLPAKQE